MEEAVTRIVERQFPELSGGYHLPRFARVIAVADPPAANGICDEFRPRYAVDLEILDANGEPDPTAPPMPGVPLPLPNGGGERGFLAFPEEGTLVVLGFAYGLPNKPFILQILPHGQSLPKLPNEDQLWQHSEAVLQRVDGAGNWTRQTDGRIRDQAMEREVEALENVERYQGSRVEIEDHATEQVGGVKRIEALGALKLLSGGSASLAAVDDLHQATGRDLNLVAGQRYNATIGADMDERIQGMRRSVAAVAQRMQAPRTWLGSADVNVLQVLCDLLDLVQEMNTQIANHAHGPTPPPNNASIFSKGAVSAFSLLERLKPVTLD
ncbi:TPA: hypothetical protein NID20_002682 [Pseudomonas aeruginosa]|nr:hypothetical protein [Pseudomonas aeruginosa]KSD50692.1 hypothetical protein AO905_25790 [Pseudomonas aeruginosa]KSH03178.1 hypothetical protein AO964_27770 [Pseudomonas aeruginosa]MBG9961326.1 hypothetical protein [Pseudomonas aeruginosa]MBX5589694.1 hypothetical protein [Pseudomonas aeruginosa]MDO5932354.1 hypothetical protein [Pseudomonas aeruginosa]